MSNVLKCVVDLKVKCNEGCDQCSKPLDREAYIGPDPFIKFYFNEVEDVKLCDVCHFKRLFDYV